ncbi:MAG TPA: hypothetical protein VJL89_09005, partial [Thermodesulfovibrionia bacterium]|nr:hypothetical protein [Thermodesulfovibrionia bacterium]
MKKKGNDSSTRKRRTVPDWVVKPLVPEEVYTDRQEFIDSFYKAALEAAHRRTWSKVLLGKRRMGKTEIFKRVVNRLFFEQDPYDQDAVVPVYYSFPETKIDNRHFAINYVENFLRYYVAFFTRQPELITIEPAGDKLLSTVKRARKLYPFTDRLDLILDKIDQVRDPTNFLPHFDALKVPRIVSDVSDTTVAMFLDEFQNTRLPQHNFDIVGFMQTAVESPTCPHFVTGSVMTILAKEILGTGALFGRFWAEKIKPLSEYWGAELVLRAAGYFKTEVPEIIAPVVAARCGGNPFYITSVVMQSANLNKPLLNEEAINEILAVDISSGFIWAELNDQVTRWIARINEFNITKWVLYLSALEQGEELDIKHIQTVLEEKEGKLVPIDTIRDTLIKLSRGDLLEYMQFGGWFRKIDDPILLEFLKVWGKIEVEKLNAQAVRKDFIQKYSTLKRKFSEYQGYVAEVFMSQILLSGTNRVIPGALFHSEEDIKIPFRFILLRHRVRLGSGSDMEIDIYASSGNEEWLCES